MKPEILFLKYAFPCSFVLKQRGEISQETLDMLENAAINSMPLGREILEKIYFRAIARMKALAKELHKDYFSEDLIREYFTKRHNELLDGMCNGIKDKGLDIDKNAPPALKHLCKVFSSKIIKKGEDYYVVHYDYGGQNKKTRVVSRSLLPDAEIGDFVAIHYGYAVEKV